jgi:hypothetical protein
MLPILRSRPSQILIAVLCTLVLSRMPAPVFGEETISTLAKVEERAALAVATPSIIDACASAAEIVTFIQHSAAADVPNHSPIEHSVLRL